MRRPAFRARLGPEPRYGSGASRRAHPERPAGARRTGLPPAESNPAGLAIEGSGYFVWDEDPRRARQWAGELDAARGKVRERR